MTQRLNYKCLDLIPEWVTVSSTLSGEQIVISEKVGTVVEQFNYLTTYFSFFLTGYYIVLAPIQVD